eukprot:12677916-Heterocapsa_arctica.AAC.1
MQKLHIIRVTVYMISLQLTVRIHSLLAAYRQPKYRYRTIPVMCEVPYRQATLSCFAYHLAANCNCESCQPPG